MLRFFAKTTGYANSELRILMQRQRLTGILQHPEAKLCQPPRHERLPTRGTPRKQLLRKLLSLRVSPARISNFQALSHAPLATTHQPWHQLLSFRLHLVCWRILFTKLRFRISFTCTMFALFLCICFDKKSIDVCLAHPNEKFKTLKKNWKENLPIVANFLYRKMLWVISISGKILISLGWLLYNNITRNFLQIIILFRVETAWDSDTNNSTLMQDKS